MMGGSTGNHFSRRLQDPQGRKGGGKEAEGSINMRTKYILDFVSRARVHAAKASGEYSAAFGYHGEYGHARFGAHHLGGVDRVFIDTWIDVSSHAITRKTYTCSGCERRVRCSHREQW